MSAYIVHPEHIGALAAFCMTRRDPYPLRSLEGQTIKETTANIARCLMLQNIASVAHAYPNYKEGNRPGPIGFTDQELVEEAAVTAALYLSNPPALKPLDIIKMCNGLEYQSCETDDYHQTVAYEQLQSIKDDAIRCLPGWDNAVRDFYDERLHGSKV